MYYVGGKSGVTFALRKKYCTLNHNYYGEMLFGSLRDKHPKLPTIIGLFIHFAVQRSSYHESEFLLSFFQKLK